MSKGNSIAYHLRQNKAVDRNLFVDLLTKINNCKNISDYTYVSFGGPFLEDFKVIHNGLKIKKMISLEVAQNTHKRQSFNMPLSCVDIGVTPQSASDFITNHYFKKKERHIIWLDYTEPAKINEQLGEIENLSNKINKFDIIKVTLNAHAETLGRETDAPYSNDPRVYRAGQLENILDAYLPYPLTENNVSSKTYPKTLLDAIYKAMSLGTSNRHDVKIVPLSAFVYADGQTMLTATAILLDNDDTKIKRFINKSRLNYWPFFNNDWLKPNNINIPAMSIKEKLFIESMLPSSTPEKIIEEMGFFIAETEPNTISELKTFIEYQRAIPWFSKIAL